ncbi:MAG: prepilin-type N-terminal cleavage/methylation domain-containing protein [Burkholderiales bacterium]|uniref:prepilin-type N-terminal cleavage/methylation domain-containing protein n=1 Tax=Inhella sp. TaxID=1921806 RepID=UPI001ACA48A7|nr:prepilin-type N-terminal cleavage/methylation domain-containing protein [Burkholderiales bacterium]
MRISAPGSRPAQRGFTLIELLVVVALVAVATATIGLSLRDPAQAQLEREGERLIALLETARAEARAAGLPVRWRPGASLEDPAQHFAFSGLPQRTPLPTRWLGEPLAVELDGQQRELLLGPEPLLPRQSLRLRLGEHQLRIASDGLQPFRIQR